MRGCTAPGETRVRLSPRADIRDKCRQPSRQAGEESASEDQRTGCPKGRWRVREGAEAAQSRAAARERNRERREKATAKVQAALDKAEREHAKRAADIQTEVEALEKRARGEEDRWKRRGRLRSVARGSRA
jgi:colicin import membrane protein